jgi:hypothetical protein
LHNGCGKSFARRDNLGLHYTSQSDFEAISRSDTDDPFSQRFTRCQIGNACNCLHRETKRFDAKVIVPALCIPRFMLVSRLYRRSKITMSSPHLCASSSYTSLPRALTPRVAKLIWQPMILGGTTLQRNKASTLQLRAENMMMRCLRRSDNPRKLHTSCSNTK